MLSISCAEYFSAAAARIADARSVIGENTAARRRSRPSTRAPSRATHRRRRQLGDELTEQRRAPQAGRTPVSGRPPQQLVEFVAYAFARTMAESIRNSPMAASVSASGTSA
jgi:hypothetical protein